ncbi:hypothetical protein BJ166DRAFT_221090 [Pestalotiopsis sp. NC0098]|nr:hypothetical protein BJ166DRAFT_221090 [Pestalotiopsis sp. NC0098]
MHTTDLGHVATYCLPLLLGYIVTTALSQPMSAYHVLSQPTQDDMTCKVECSTRRSVYRMWRGLQHTSVQLVAIPARWQSRDTDATLQCAPIVRGPLTSLPVVVADGRCADMELGEIEPTNASLA